MIKNIILSIIILVGLSGCDKVANMIPYVPSVINYVSTPTPIITDYYVVSPYDSYVLYYGD